MTVYKALERSWNQIPQAASGRVPSQATTNYEGMKWHHVKSIHQSLVMRILEQHREAALEAFDRQNDGDDAVIDFIQSYVGKKLDDDYSFVNTAAGGLLDPCSPGDDDCKMRAILKAVDATAMVLGGARASVAPSARRARMQK